MKFKFIKNPVNNITWKPSHFGESLILFISNGISIENTNK